MSNLVRTLHGRKSHDPGCRYVVGKDVLPGDGYPQCSTCGTELPMQTSPSPIPSSSIALSSSDISYTDRFVSKKWVTGDDWAADLSQAFNAAKQDVEHLNYDSADVLTNKDSGEDPRVLEDFYRVLIKIGALRRNDDGSALLSRGKNVRGNTKRMGPVRWHREGKRHVVDRTIGKDLSDYEKALVCCANPDFQNRSMQELRLIHEQFAQCLWDAYDTRIPHGAVSEQVVERCIASVVFASEEFFDKQRESTRTEAFLAHAAYPDKERMRIYCRDRSVDILFILMHEAMHYLTARNREITPEDAYPDLTQQVGISLRTPEPNQSLMMRAAYHIGAIQPQPQPQWALHVFLNERLTDAATEQMLAGTPYMCCHDASQYEQLVAAEPLLQLMHHDREVCDSYMRGDLGAIERRIAMRTGYPQGLFSLEHFSRMLDIASGMNYFPDTLSYSVNARVASQNIQSQVKSIMQANNNNQANPIAVDDLSPAVAGLTIEGYTVHTPQTGRDPLGHDGGKEQLQ